ncbi:MAG TPA: twin-arginine translocase TatA/TatE family subunit [Dehalococcoidia bacterium]|nr:twin-arginine translocase TatA/TatE family subunit [Dehalococcoidia bacterium]
MNFFGLGGLEIVLILLLGFLFFGPEKLPGIAAKAGKFMRNFSKATGELQRTLTSEISIEKELQENKPKSSSATPINKPEDKSDSAREKKEENS